MLARAGAVPISPTVADPHCLVVAASRTGDLWISVCGRGRGSSLRCDHRLESGPELPKRCTGDGEKHDPTGNHWASEYAKPPWPFRRRVSSGKQLSQHWRSIANGAEDLDAIDRLVKTDMGNRFWTAVIFNPALLEQRFAGRR